MWITFTNSILIIKTPEETSFFVTEMKELHGMGYARELPQNLWECFETAKRFYSEHIILKQLVNTINSLENRMLECQKPMIKKEMEQLEEILQFPRGKKKKYNRENLVWESVEELQAFTDTLSRWQTNLSDTLKKLHNAHYSI
jgi:hypothetical protein